MMRRVNILCSFALLFASQNSLAVTYPLPLNCAPKVRHQTKN